MKRSIASKSRHKSHASSSVKQHLAYILKPSFRSLLFFLVAGIFLFSCENTEEAEPSSEASITSLTLTIESSDYEITFTDKEGTLTLPYATDLPAAAVVKTVVLSAKAKGVKVGDTLTIPALGTVTFTVTAEDDKTKDVYTLTVEKASASTEASITSLTLTVGSTDYEIDFTDRGHTLVLPAGSTLPTAVGVKEITLSDGAKSETDNGIELSVSDNAVTITVTAEDGTKSTYTVTFSVAANEGASITYLTLTAGSTNYAVTFEGTQGSVTLPYGSTLPTEVEVKEIILSDGAASDTGNGIKLSITDNAITITVTAADGETKSEYTVTFSVAANSEASVTSLTLTIGDTDYEIMFEDRQDTITVPYSTALPADAVVKTVVLSAKATGIKIGDAVTIPASGTVTLTVTAEDGKTKVYTLTVEKVSARTEASITSLTFTVGDSDYEIDFTDRAYTLILLSGTARPTAVEVKEITLSSGAKSDTGNGTKLTVTDNAVTITVTAEDGTTTNTYTVRLVASVGITSFTFEVADNENMALDEADRKRIEGRINQQDNTITFIEQSAYVYLDKLKATFEVSETGATVQVGGVDQTSGVTEQDFRSPVSYVVRAQDGMETTYKVTLLKSNIARIPDPTVRKKLKEIIADAFIGDYNIDITHNSVVTYNGKLSFRYVYPAATSLKGIEFLTALDFLNLFWNGITSVDLRKNTALTWFSCNRNALTSLDVSQNTALEYLFCSDNPLGSLDVSKNTALKTLECHDTGITSIDVSKNTALTKLRVDDDVSLSLNKNKKQPAFKNALTSLDLSKNTALTFLSCSGNALTSLDLSQNMALKYLECDNNLITSLDLSEHTALNSVYCRNNRITYLDVGKSATLSALECDLNALTFLDMRGMRQVYDLKIGEAMFMSDNPLLATLRVNTILQDRHEFINMKTNRGAALTVTTVNNEGTVVCADYTPAKDGGTCNDN